MQAKKVFSFLLVVSLTGFGGVGCLAEADSKAKAMAQSIHEELDRLYTAGDVEAQVKYFADNLVRLDPNRPISQGRESWLEYASSQNLGGIEVEGAKTQVIDAWHEGQRLYEYGTSALRIRSPGAQIVDDPTTYFAIWNVEADPKLEFLIWNQSKPVEEVELLGGLGKREAAAHPQLRVSEDKGAAVELAQQIYSRLDQLQVKGKTAEHLEYFADDVVRADPNRAISRGVRRAGATLEGVAKSIRITDQKTSVIDAWQMGGRLYSYGTSHLFYEPIDGGGGGDDPTAFFGIWDVSQSQPQLQFMIWNTTQPVEALELLAQVGR